jgi:FdhE protein
VSILEEHHKRALERVEQLSELRPELSGLLAYYRSLVESGRDLTSDFKFDLNALDGEACRQRAAEGKALLGPDELQVDWASFDRLLARLVETSGDRRDVIGEEVELPRVPTEPNGWHRDLLGGLMHHGAVSAEVSERAGGDPRLLAFLAFQALVPFAAAGAWELRGLVDASSWARGRCPICGSDPVMARLEPEGGKRFLQCGLCLTEWAFKRVGCPACGNEDQEKLRFFSEEADESYRVEVCDNCKGYIKTVDERKVGGTVCLPVEDLVTVHLDMVAEEEGFHREGGGFPAGG